MARHRPPHYCGATGRVTRAAIGKLSRAWAIQPKADGIYAQIDTDAHGVITRVRSRTGRAWRTDLVGVQAYLPCATIVGELTAGTEKGCRRAADEGYDSADLFDVIRACGEPVYQLPYWRRRDILYACHERAQEAEEAPGKVAHCVDTGRFKRPVPAAWQRLRIIPQYRPADLDYVLAEYVYAGLAEGVVAVRLDAAVGDRACKRRCKEGATVDALVLESGTDGVLVQTGDQIYLVAPRQYVPLPGTWVEVLIEGRYTSGLPKFARLVRPRPDLA